MLRNYIKAGVRGLIRHKKALKQVNTNKHCNFGGGTQRVNVHGSIVIYMY